MGGCGLDSPGSGHGPVAVSCEHGNGFHNKRGISPLPDYQLLKEDSSPWS